MTLDMASRSSMSGAVRFDPLSSRRVAKPDLSVSELGYLTPSLRLMKADSSRVSKRVHAGSGRALPIEWTLVSLIPSVRAPMVVMPRCSLRGRLAGLRTGHVKKEMYQCRPLT